MYRMFIGGLLLLFSLPGLSQGMEQLVYHDTTILNATSAQWIVRSLVKNDTAIVSRIGSTLPTIILEEAVAGRIILFDPDSKKPIPPGKVMSWNMPMDTVVVDDGLGNFKYKVIQQELDPSSFSRIRLFSDWYFDILSGNFKTMIRWLDLMAEVKTLTGDFRGYRTYFRIYY